MNGSAITVICAVAGTTVTVLALVIACIKGINVLDRRYVRRDECAMITAGQCRDRRSDTDRFAEFKKDILDAIRQNVKPR